MKINGNTKVSKVIKENREAIEVIASLNSHFKKLKNPILRRLLAPRVTLSEAAKIGKCEVQEILDRLVSIGFELADGSTEKATNDFIQRNTKENFLKGQKTNSLDVRPLLAKGEDPFKIIQKALKTLSNDEVLDVLIDFEPIPLIRIQEKKGYSTLTVVENQIYHTYFKAGKATKNVNSNSEISVKTVSQSEYNKLINTYPGEIRRLDVRNLEMPEPLVRILEEIKKIKENTSLEIVHKKIPQHLLPELETKNLNTFICPISEVNVMLFITQKNA